MYIMSCKIPVEAWKILCNINETKCLSNILFVYRKFCTCKMEDDDDLLDHINKVKAFAYQLTCLEVPMRIKDIVITLLESFMALYNYFITAFKTMPMKELTMKDLMTHLMYKISKHKENE